MENQDKRDRDHPDPNQNETHDHHNPPDTERPGLTEAEQMRTMEADLIWAKERAREASLKAQMLEERAEQSERQLGRQERHLVSQRHDLRRAWWGMLVLAGALIAGGWWGYLSLREGSDSLAQISDIQESLDSLWAEVSSSQEGLGTLSSETETFRQKLAKLEADLREGLQSARSQTRRLADGLDQTIRAAVYRYVEPIRDRLASLESDEQASRSRLASLDREMQALREDMTRQMASLRENTWQNLESVKAKAAVSKDRLEATQRDVARLMHDVDRERTYFEVTGDQAEELIPGVYLTVKGSDGRRQSLDGWLWLSSDRRVLWLDDQGVLEPIVFHTLDDDRAREVVLTRITDQGAAGYVLAPVSSDATINLTDD